MASLSLFELNEHLRRVVALNFPEPLWVRCELAQVSPWRGHHFLTLIEKDPESEEIIAHSEGVFWEGDYLRAFQRVGRLLEELLQEGMEVQLKVQPVFHERHGLQLKVLDVDPSYTLGQWELRRRHILEQLQKEGLLELNRQRPLPVVLQRIAVVSSAQAAGWQDFRRHLEENEFGYRFQLRFFQVAMQGALVREEVSDALNKIAAQAADFDAVVLIRGGGARLDLAAFDDLDL
ncbi:MAG: exodeoxyribonuclease VII large subunit, partial [Bacteroidetes bacterium]